MNVALLTAAGSGVRMGRETPKQFLHVEDKPIVVHTMERFQRHPGIDAIIVVTLPSWIDVLWAYAKEFGVDKLRWVVPGGATGQESICLGVRELAAHCTPEDTVIIHDGNRPMVSQEIISNCLAVFREKGSAVAAIPCVEATFRSTDGLTSVESVPREQLWRTQTPHAYPLGKLLWAFDEADRLHLTGMAATCTLMQQLGETVYFSKGSEENLKITTPDDLQLFKALLRMEREGRSE